MFKRICTILLMLALISSSLITSEVTVNAADAQPIIVKNIWDADVLSNGDIVMVYESLGDVYLGRYIPSSKDWSKEIIGSGDVSSIDVGSDDTIHIAYIDSNDDLVYLKITSSGNTTSQTIDSRNIDKKGVVVTTGKLSSPDISVDSDGYVHIGYMDTLGGQPGATSYYQHNDVMYATNQSGIMVVSVAFYGEGWYFYGDGSYNNPTAPVKITYASGAYYLGFRNISGYKSSLSGWDKEYYFCLYTNDATPTNNVSTHYSSSSSTIWKLYDMDTDGLNPYRLSNKSGVLMLDVNNNQIANASVTYETKAADLFCGAGIYYAAANTSDLLLYQQGNIKSSITLPSPLSTSHSNIVTVVSGNVQYIIYTDGSGNMQISGNKTSDSSDNSLSTYVVPDLKEVEITGININDKVYDQKAIEFTGNAMAAEKGTSTSINIPSYDFIWMTASGDSLTNAPIKAGDYNLVVKVSEDNPEYFGSLVLPFTIEAKKVTISGIVALDRVYNGLTTVTINGGSLQGIYEGDTVSANVPTTGSLAFASAEISKPVTLGTITLMGTDNSNYTLTQPKDITVTISQKDISIDKVTLDSKDYDGNNLATVSKVKFLGLQNNESLDYGLDYEGTAVYENINVGSSIEVNGLITLLHTKKAANYNLVDENYSSFGSIDKSSDLQVLNTPDAFITEGLVHDYTYDLGQIDLNKTDTGNKTYSLGLLSGSDLFTIIPSIDSNGSTLKYSSANKLIGSASQYITISSENYDTVYTTLNFVLIDKTPLTLSGPSLENKTYDGQPLTVLGDIVAMNQSDIININEYTYKWHQVENGVVVKQLLDAPKDVGDYRLIIEISNSNSMYQGSLELNSSINAKALTTDGIIAAEKEYDGGTTVSLSGGILIGIIENEDVTLNLPATATLDTQNVGTNKPVSFSASLSGNDSDNYILIQPTNVVATIKAKPLTISAATVADKAFDSTTDGIISNVQLVGTIDNEQLIENTDYTYVGAFESINAMVDAPFVVTVTLANTSIAANYSIPEADFTTTATISKINGLTGVFNDKLTIYNNYANDYTFALNQIDFSNQDTGAFTFTVDSIIGDDIFVTPPMINANGYTLEVDVISTTETTTSLNLICSTQNYDDIFVTIDFELVNKPRSTPSTTSVTTLIPDVTVPEALPISPLFNDLTNHWARLNIERIVNLGIIKGYTDGTSKPNNTITRSEFVTIIMRALKEDSLGMSPFGDLEGHWARTDIEAAYSLGIIHGTKHTTFAPNGLVTREQIAKIVCLAFNIEKSDTPLTFDDSNEISSWAQGYVSALVELGIINGYTDDSFKPLNPSTRAEASAIVERALIYQDTLIDNN